MWRYLKGMVEGADGSLSLRRFITLVFIALIIYVVIKGISNQFLLNALYSFEAALMLLIGIITTDNIISFFKNNKV